MNRREKSGAFEKPTYWASANAIVCQSTWFCSKGTVFQS